MQHFNCFLSTRGLRSSVSDNSHQVSFSRILTFFLFICFEAMTFMPCTHPSTAWSHFLHTVPGFTMVKAPDNSSG